MSDDFLLWLEELCAALGRIRARRMFGGHGLYRGERMFGLVFEQRLYLKTDAATVDAFRSAGCTPFVYESRGKAITLSYWSVPDDALDSAEAMTPWLRLAWQAAERQPRARARRTD